jgi:hypothetical protein
VLVVPGSDKGVVNIHDIELGHHKVVRIEPFVVNSRVEVQRIFCLSRDGYKQAIRSGIARARDRLAAVLCINGTASSLALARRELNGRDHRDLAWQNFLPIISQR